MTETMLHAVLNMPPDLWSNDALDQSQRAARYVEASKLIESLEKQVMAYKNALELIAISKAEHDNATLEMERDGMKLIARIALDQDNLN